MALALLARTPSDPESEIRGTLYGVEAVTLGYLASRQPWADKARPSEASEEVPRFSTLVDLILLRRGSTELAKTLLHSIKERSKEELPYWGSQRLHLQDPVEPEEPLLEMDDHVEVEKWEHVEELLLWMKHALDLTIDIVSKDLAKDFFVSAPPSTSLCIASSRRILTDFGSHVFFPKIGRRPPG